MRLGTLIVLFFVLVCNVGCLSPVALNTMGTAGSSAPVAFNNEGGGRGESFWIAKYDDVIAATLRAGEALSLELKEKRIENDQTFFRFYDGKRERIDLFIERRTDTMTSIKFKVGWFGSVAFGRLLARQIIFELYESGSFLEDWTSETNN
jgi:hypothetical protein